MNSVLYEQKTHSRLWVIGDYDGAAALCSLVQGVHWCVAVESR